MSGLLRSWVPGANDPEGPFPLNNLPCGVFSTRERRKSLGIAIGDRIVDLRALSEAGHVRHGSLHRPYWNGFEDEAWNGLMASGTEFPSVFRRRLADELAEDAAGPLREGGETFLVPLADAVLHMPFTVAEFTDFYASREHATNVGIMFRGPDNALPPNWLHLPAGYNGRASSVVVSDTPVTRPWGQVRGPDDPAPRFAPSARFDFELELGAVVGTPSKGPITVAEADEAIFGYVLLNDWSARDIQAWEYQPLGPFQSKATATTISPWIVTAAALKPFRTAAPAREVPLLPHLREPGPMHYDVALEAALAPEGSGETVVTRTNYGRMYYSAAQQIAHHASSGCPMRTGDLIGSGTVSGSSREERGSMLELSWGGREPLALECGAARTFLEDGDTVTLRGHAQGDGYRIGFGECRGRLMPAPADPYARKVAP